MYILDDTAQLLYDPNRERELMKILGIQSMDEVTIIPWRSPDIPPQEARYVLLKFYDSVMDEITFDVFAYENGAYSHQLGDGSWFELAKSQILGWAYPISIPNK